MHDDKDDFSCAIAWYFCSVQVANGLLGGFRAAMEGGWGGSQWPRQPQGLTQLAAMGECVKLDVGSAQGTGATPTTFKRSTRWMGGPYTNFATPPRQTYAAPATRKTKRNEILNLRRSAHKHLRPKSAKQFAEVRRPRLGKGAPPGPVMPANSHPGGAAGNGQVNLPAGMQKRELLRAIRVLNAAHERRSYTQNLGPHTTNSFPSRGSQNGTELTIT